MYISHNTESLVMLHYYVFITTYVDTYASTHSLAYEAPSFR